MKIEFNRLFNKLKENNLTQKEFKAKAEVQAQIDELQEQLKKL